LPPKVKEEKGEKHRPWSELAPDLNEVKVKRSMTGQDLGFSDQSDRLREPNSIDEKEDPRENHEQ
jgi:hypothetical protein